VNTHCCQHVDVQESVLKLLAHPTIASKEAIIRRYDHEILGSTVVRPMSGADQIGPSDGVVIVEPTRSCGFSLGIGVNPQYGLYDPERMAHAVVDEAIRNVVVAGADPRQIALLDNFSWGDPRRESTLGDLVATVAGCCDAALTYGTPFVSGKDSLNNEYTDSDGTRHSIPPTLVITALGHVPDVDRVVSTSLHKPDNVIIMLGHTRDELRGSHLHLILGGDFGGEVPAPDPAAPTRYVALHQAILAGLVESAHDCSEGGASVALAEMVMSSQWGIEASLNGVNEVTALFAESVGRIFIEVAPDKVDVVMAMFPGDAQQVGHVSTESSLVITTASQTYSWSKDELLSAWSPTTGGVQ
jgi:phosphoribosylformylglycinamidine synthase subunit PurSL